MVSTRYSQVNALRTIEDILGTRAHQPEHRVPAADGRRVRHPFLGRVDLRRRSVDGAGDDDACARAPGGLGVKYASGPIVKPKHDAAYWAQGHRRLRLLRRRPRAAAQFNRVLWRGLKGGEPYPASIVRHVALNRDRDERDRD